MPQRASEIEAAHRAALCEGKTTFLKVLADNGLWLALDELVPYAHWITPEGMPKRFDTWFFLAAAPPEQLGAHDGKESTDSIWVSPREALEGGESGRFKLPFPTTRNLIKLGKQPSVRAALDDARGKTDRHRDAGHDQAQRRPPAPHSRARPAMTASCSKSARSARHTSFRIEISRPLQPCRFCPDCDGNRKRGTWKKVARRARNSRDELALLLLLATLWGASYTFIKLGVATIPPITLIAARTLIAGVLLLLIMRWRGVRMPTDAATWRPFAVQACLNSVIPWTLIAWGERSVDAGACDHSQFDRADLHLPPHRTRHPAPDDNPAKTVRRYRGHGRHLPDRRRARRSIRSGRSFGAEIADRRRHDLLRRRRDLQPGLQGPRSDGARRRLAALRRGDADPAQSRGRAALDLGAILKLDTWRCSGSQYSRPRSPS